MLRKVDSIHNLGLCLGHEDILEESSLDFDCEAENLERQDSHGDHSKTAKSKKVLQYFVSIILPPFSFLSSSRTELSTLDKCSVEGRTYVQLSLYEHFSSLYQSHQEISSLCFHILEMSRWQKF